jgi:hypothetical protein
MTNGALLHARWSRERNGGGRRGRHRGDVCDVGVLLGLVLLLAFAFASAFTALAFVLAVLTLVLLLVIVALLLVRTALLAMPVRVAVLALNHADLISIVLLRAMADRVCLKLSHHGGVHFAKVEVIHLN